MPLATRRWRRRVQLALQLFVWEAPQYYGRQRGGDILARQDDAPQLAARTRRRCTSIAAAGTHASSETILAAEAAVTD